MKVHAALTPARRAGLLTVWWLTVAGGVTGLIWLLTAPRAKIQIASDGSGYYLDPSPREYIHADLIYAGLSLLLAVLAAVAVRRYLRQYPIAAVTGLAVGGQLAALVIWQIGVVFAPLDRAGARVAKPGAIVLDALDLGAKGLLLLLPVAALATWLAIDLITTNTQAGTASPAYRHDLDGAGKAGVEVGASTEPTPQVAGAPGPDAGQESTTEPAGPVNQGARSQPPPPPSP